MTNEIPPPATTISQFSLRSLFVATTLFAIVLGVSSWLGPLYGVITAIPLTLGLPLYLCRPTVWRGALVGFVAFALLGKFAIIGWQDHEPQYIPTLITIGAFGSTLGAAVHTFFLRKKWLGGFLGVVTLVTFIVLLFW